MSDDKHTSANAFGDDPLPVAPCKCGYQWRADALPEEVCHHGNGEYIVICPRCKANGELKATPRWAVEAWNNRAGMSDDKLVETIIELVASGALAGDYSKIDEARAAITALQSERASMEGEIERLREGFNLARNRLRAAAINEAPKGTKEYYQYSEWADEADATLAALTSSKTGDE